MRFKKQITIKYNAEVFVVICKVIMCGRFMFFDLALENTSVVLCAFRKDFKLHTVTCTLLGVIARV